MNTNTSPIYHSTVFLVTNIEKSKKFYIDVLGQKIENDFGRCVEFTGGFSIWERSYAHKMMGIKEAHISTNRKDAELYFEINDLDSLFERLKRKKIAFVHQIIEQPWGQRCLRIYDPDHHIIELAEPMKIVVERFYNQGLTQNQIIEQSLMPKEFVLNVISDINTLKNDRFTKELIAPCGMNCRICIAFFGYMVNGNKRKMRCIGCKPKDKNCAFLKKYCTKLRKNKIDYCYECTDFPCSHLEKIDSLYQKRYDMSMIENLEYIHTHGINDFLRQQQEKYRCPECGGIICVHNGICYSCEQAKEN